MQKWVGLISIGLLGVLSLYFSDSALAKDFGVQGAIYSIEEPDLLEWITERLQTLQATGRLSQLEVQEQNIARAYVERPKSVEKLTPALTNRFFYYDPTVALSAALRDTTGNVVYPAGTQFNPLSQVTLHHTLLFFDGDDSDQLRWAEKQDRQLKRKTKIILVKGSIREQLAHWQRPVYFDQAGVLVKKLGITHIPAEVTQVDNRLLIKECHIHVTNN
jgi:conjugal transfer pilus assembly protein TraW